MGSRLILYISFVKVESFRLYDATTPQKSNTMSSLPNTLLRLFAFLLFSLTSFAQNYEWAKTMGGNKYDYGKTIINDQNGNSYIVGSYEDTVDLDPNAGTLLFNTSSVYGNMFVQKLDPNGNLLWVRSFGDTTGSGYVGGGGIAIDQASNIYISGGLNGTVDFDPGSGNHLYSSDNSQDAMVLKLDENGETKWVRLFSGPFSSVAEAISYDNNGNIYTTGKFEDSIDFDPSSNDYFAYAISRDVFIHKLDTAGNFIWARTLESPNGGNYGHAISNDSQGNVIITGEFPGTIDFDPSAGVFNITATGSDDTFIHKMDQNGNFLWVKTFQANSNSGVIGQSLSVDNADNIFVSGLYVGSVDFDPGINTNSFTSMGNEDMFISKLDPSGNYLWLKSIGGSGTDMIGSSKIDNLGAIYVSGIFQNTVDFDPGPNTNSITSGQTDLFILKLNTSGLYEWVYNSTTTLFTSPRALSLDNGGYIYASGGFEGSVNLNPNGSAANFTSNGESDILILKLSQPTSNLTPIDDINCITAAPNPFKDRIKIEASNGEIGNLELFSIQGKKAASFSFSNASAEIDLSSLANGVYYIQCEGMKPQKIVKE